MDYRCDPEYSDQDSRPQTLSILFTSPESDLADIYPPSPAEDFQIYTQLMVCMVKSLDLQIHRPTTELVDHISKDSTNPHFYITIHTQRHPTVVDEASIISFYVEMYQQPLQSSQSWSVVSPKATKF